MKKKLLCFVLAALCLFSALALAGCGQTAKVDENAPAAQGGTQAETPGNTQQPDETEETEPAQPEESAEPETTEEPDEPAEPEQSEEPKEPDQPEEAQQPVEPEESEEPDEPEGPEGAAMGDPLSLSEEEQFRINIFLSNFAEQFMSDFDAETATEAELLQFAYMNTRINGGELSFTEDGYARMSLEQVNSKLQRYMGLQMDEPEEGAVFHKWYDVTYRDGAFLFPYGDGESYSGMAVADAVYDKGDGTYQVFFSVYSVVEFSTGGNKIPDSSYYRISPAQAEADEGYEWICGGEAVVTPYQAEGVDSYHLLKFKLY